MSSGLGTRGLVPSVPTLSTLKGIACGTPAALFRSPVHGAFDFRLEPSPLPQRKPVDFGPAFNWTPLSSCLLTLGSRLIRCAIMLEFWTVVPYGLGLSQNARAVSSVGRAADS